MASVMKHVIRVGVIGALLVGAGVVIAGPHRVRAMFHQARDNINCKIDRNITDPVALRAQLRDLAGQYPKRIAEVRSDLTELREQLGLRPAPGTDGPPELTSSTEKKDHP